MGTNYYWYPWLSRDEGRLHIGKSSCGWCFSLHVDADEYLFDLDDWLQRLVGGRIEDEYGTTLMPSQLLNVIMGRGRYPRSPADGEYGMDDDEMARNHAVRGPRGLLRNRLSIESMTGDGGCIGHGDGTWDLIEGEFS